MNPATTNVVEDFHVAAPKVASTATGEQGVGNPGQESGRRAEAMEVTASSAARARSGGMASSDTQGSVQHLVEALSLSLGRPILLDDADLAPIAFSRQWNVDLVRTSGILARGVPGVVENELQSQIADAVDVVRIPGDGDIGMEPRVCLPIRDSAGVLAYLWLLDVGTEITEAELDLLRDAGRVLTRALSHVPSFDQIDDTDLVLQLTSPDSSNQDQGVDIVRERGILRAGKLVVCVLGAAIMSADPFDAARRAARRLSVGYAITGRVDEGAVLLASLEDPVLRVLGDHQVSNWVGSVVGAQFNVGQSEPAALGELPVAFDRARLAFRVASSRSDRHAVAWGSLGADRLVVQMPGASVNDIPTRVKEILDREPVMRETLECFLDHAGNVKETSAALSLQRGGLYHRLHRIEELSGLDLGNGDDRLLAHLAIRAIRLRSAVGA